MDNYDLWGEKMTELSKEIFDKYQARRSKEHKTEFIRFLEKSFLPYGLSFDYKPMGSFGSRNIVVGDIENAKIIFTAHYDTCQTFPCSVRIMPKHKNLSLVRNILSALPTLFLILILSLSLMFVFLLLNINYIITMVFTYGALFVLLYFVFFGKENANTANDNTSGVITLCEILASAKKEQLEKIAFVFFDNEEKGLLGSKCFRKKYKSAVENKLIVNIDAVSDGDYIIIVKNKENKEIYDNAVNESFCQCENKTILFESSKEFHFSSDQKGFPQNIAIAAFKKSRFGNLYLDRIHTKKDTKFDESNIEYIKNASLKLIDNI